MHSCNFCHIKSFKDSNSLKNHERRCACNSSRISLAPICAKGNVAWNKGLNKSDPRIMKQANKLRGKPASGGCCIWTSEQRREAAIAQGFGGYRQNAGRSKKFRVNDSYGKQVVLQSTYELRCSEILNELKIKWVRPPCLFYNGKRYFPDFYLPDFDIYLDPKNDYKALLDKKKIKDVIIQNNVFVEIILNKQLNIKYIQRLLGIVTVPSPD